MIYWHYELTRFFISNSATIELNHSLVFNNIMFSLHLSFTYLQIHSNCKFADTLIYTLHQGPS